MNWSKSRNWVGFAVAFALCFAASARAVTTWGYVPTNAFTGLTFTNPVCITAPPGETNRLFVVEKRGRIIVVTNLVAPTRTVFMDITGRVTVQNSTDQTDVFGEEGLLGLAFHPGYSTNGYFYVFYTGQATNQTTGLHDILSRFQVSSMDTNHADTNSEVRFISQYDQAVNHNAGDVHFGADGYLYISLGDEGGSYDNFANSQRIDKDYFSAIMRIDVDNAPGNLAPNPHPSLPSLTNYAVPFDNPWVGATNFNNKTVNSNDVRTEFWAVGMRNPWRWSFDPVTGEMYVGHVGQSTVEWLNLVNKGDNAGWNYFEGSKQWTNTASLPAGFTHIPPLTEYGRTNNRSAIIGGVVCYAARTPQLAGAYLYGDESSSEVFALRHTGMAVTQNTVLFRDTNALISCFGIDPSNGDVLYAALRSGTNSLIKRIISTNAVPFITTVQVSGTDLIVAGTNGPPSGQYFLLTSTNVALPPANWLRVSTNSFDTSGNFILTNPIDPGGPHLFELIQVQ